MKKYLFTFLLSLILAICFTAISNVSIQNIFAQQSTQNPTIRQENLNQLQTTENSQLSDVSIIALIANPEKYDGKKVRLIGYVHLEFEGNAIYLHHDFQNLAISRNALWINTTEEIAKNRAKYNDKYIIVEGTFNARDHGHMGMFSGAIENIKRFDVWAEKTGWR